MKIIGIHGIYSTGERSVGKLCQYIQHLGYQTLIIQFNLDITDTYDDNYINSIANKVVSNYGPNDIILAHSAGCLITAKVLEILKGQDITIPVIWFFNAGIDKDYQFSDNYGTIYNVIDQHDIVTQAADLLPCSKLGSMGSDGYQGQSPNIIDITYQHKEHQSLLNHGEFFELNEIQLPIQQIIETLGDVK